MKNIEKVIDINAHIEHLRCTIITEGGVATAKISFDNLGFGDITAIKFNACGYNSFGDIVTLNGKDKFFLIIQDFKVIKNEKATDLKVKLPDANIRRLDLTESQVCYSDGTVLTYEGENSVTFSLEEFYEPSEELMVLRKIYDPKVKYIPKDFENGWICTCGRFNSFDKSQCSLCGNFKAMTMRAFSDSNRKKVIEDYRKQEEQEREKQIAENERKEKESRKRKKYIAAGALLAFAIIIFCLVQSKIIKKEIYSSVDEMRADMQGNWSHYGDYGVMWQIRIIGDKAIQVYSSGIFEPQEKDVKWNPSEGTFIIGGDTYIVHKGGRKLQEGDYEYEKGGYIPTKSEESAYTVLEIEAGFCYTSGNYTICEGKITNNGEKTYKFIKVKGSFKDCLGKELDTNSTYAVNSDGLEPGESSSFKLSVYKDPNIFSCSISLLDYD